MLIYCWKNKNWAPSIRQGNFERSGRAKEQLFDFSLEEDENKIERYLIGDVEAGASVFTLDGPSEHFRRAISS